MEENQRVHLNDIDPIRNDRTRIDAWVTGAFKELCGLQPEEQVEAIAGILNSVYLLRAKELEEAAANLRIKERFMEEISNVQGGLWGPQKEPSQPMEKSLYNPH